MVDAPAELITLLASTSAVGCRSWANQVLSDLCTIHNFALSPLLPDPETHPIEWFSFVRANPRVFKDALKEYKSMVAGTIPSVEPKVDSFRTELTPCPYCDKQLPFYKLASHLYAKHGIKNNIRAHVSGTICICYRKDFHTRKKLIHHISFRSAQCKKRWLRSPCIPEDEYRNLELQSSIECKQLAAIGRSALFWFEALPWAWPFAVCFIWVVFFLSQ